MAGLLRVEIKIAVGTHIAREIRGNDTYPPAVTPFV
jgi:hypothetical protein